MDIIKIIGLHKRRLNLSDKWNYELYACLLCGYCNPVCPFTDEIGWESVTPRGKLYFLKNEAGGKALVDEEIAEKVYQCSVCKACEDICQVNIPLVEFWEELRYKLIGLGQGPMPAHLRMRDAIVKKFNPFNESPANRSNWMSEKITEGSDLMFFGGCTASYRMTAIAESAVKILSASGVSFNYLRTDEWCCGAPLFQTGLRDDALDIVRHNIESLKDHGAKRIVTPCSECYKTLSIDYKRWAELMEISYDIEVVHISQLILELIKEKKLEFKNELNASVTYHDSCYLGRHMGEYEAPREVLKSIPGLRLVEMDTNRQDAMCCGAGGGVKAAFPELSSSISRRRLDEAVETEAEVLAGSCPLCKYNLSEMAKGDIEVKDLTELVAEALG